MPWDGVEVAVTVADVTVFSKTLGKGAYIIGQNGAEIRVDAPGVAERHARLHISEAGATLENLTSDSSIYIDGRRTEGVVSLRSGETATFGQSAQLTTCWKDSNLRADPTLPPARAALMRTFPQLMEGGERYRAGEMIAKGGMGAVFLAQELTTRRRVAMKIINQELMTDGQLARFVDEARITAELEHPNIVPVHELGLRADDRVFYTMKLVEGVTLQEAINGLKGGVSNGAPKYDLPKLLTVFQKICDGVSFAHSRGVIHRDLKPSNIMIGPFGEVMVMDWGLARRIPGDKADCGNSIDFCTTNNEHSQSAVAGTPSYMAPEQVDCRSKADERTDIYALGGILYTILKHRTPVSGKNLDEILTKVRTGAIEALQQRIEPESLGAVVRRAMALDRNKRYPSVAELQNEIAAYQAGFATRAEHATLPKQLWLAIRRHRVEASVAAVAAAALFAIGAIYFIHVKEERDRANAALRSLATAAPLFAGEAKILAENGRITEAIQRLDYALTLNSNHLQFVVVRAHLLQSQFRFADALEGFTHALALDPASSTNAAHADICRQMLQVRVSSPEARPILCRLLTMMAAEKRSIPELTPCLRALSIPPTLISRFSLHESGLRLNAAGTTLTNIDFIRGLPITSLDLSECINLADLEPLRSLPLHQLNLSGCIGIDSLEPLRNTRLRNLTLFHTRIHDLTPLQNLPLEILDLRRSSIADISPLRGMALRELYLWQSRVQDLSTLTTLQLEVLDASETPLATLAGINFSKMRLLRLGHTAISDISPLAGSPVDTLHFDAVNVTNVEALLECKKLRWAIIPRATRNVDLLKTHPSLQRLSYGWNNESQPSHSVKEFWEIFDSKK